jgi:hypothetical protein
MFLRGLVTPNDDGDVCHSLLIQFENTPKLELRSLVGETCLGETPLVMLGPDSRPLEYGEKLEVEPNWLVERDRGDFLRRWL